VISTSWQTVGWRLYSNLAQVARVTPGLKPLLRKARLGRWLDTLCRQAAIACLPNPIIVHDLVLHYPRLGVHTIPQMAAGNFEVQTRLVIERSLRPGMLMVDLGAHIGYFSLLAARCVGATGNVYAFEPEPEAFSFMKKNIQANRQQHVIMPVAKAVANTVGSATLFLGTSDTVQANIYRPVSARAGTVTVETTTLDHFFAQEGWPPVHLIKMDIQGAEQPALEGMNELLAKQPSVKLIVDFCPNSLEAAGGTPESFFDALSSLGFCRFAALEHGPKPVSIPEDIPLLVRMSGGDCPVNVLCETSATD
jgi:FkbM family methyltransferase